jgi:hypothetical protein
MSPLNALIVAEKLVDNLGDPNWFREHYTLAREYHGVLDSVEMALEKLQVNPDVRVPSQHYLIHHDIHELEYSAHETS